MYCEGLLMPLYCLVDWVFFSLTVFIFFFYLFYLFLASMAGLAFRCFTVHWIPRWCWPLHSTRVLICWPWESWHLVHLEGSRVVFQWKCIIKRKRPLITLLLVNWILALKVTLNCYFSTWLKICVKIIYLQYL